MTAETNTTQDTERTSVVTEDEVAAAAAALETAIGVAGVGTLSETEIAIEILTAAAIDRGV